MTRTEFITKAANGNEAALAFLRVYWDRAHLLDDMIDAPGSVSDEALAKSEADWIQQLTGNPFVLAHSARLVPVMLLGINAWLDSNRWVSSDARQVLAGQWHDVVYTVALLTGGWAGLRHASEKRPYDWADEPKGGD